MPEFTTWRSLVDGQEYSAIPDSAVLNFNASNFAEPWPNDVENEPDMSVSGLSSTTLSDDSDGVEGDGVDDVGEVDPPSALTGSDLLSHTIEFSIEFDHDDVGRFITNIDSNSEQALQIGLNEPSTGNVSIFIDDKNDDRLEFHPDDNPNLNDGNVHKVTFEIVDSANNDANIYIDGSSVDVNFVETGGPDNYGSWDFDYAFWAQRASDGGLINHAEAASGIIRWHNEATGQQTI